MPSAVTVRDVVALLDRWQARVVGGAAGLGRAVSWASTMRARVPAFEGLRGEELALLSLATLRVLRAQVESLTLPALVDQLAALGASGVVVVEAPAPGAGSDAGETASTADALAEAGRRADRYALPLIALPAGTALAPVEREVQASVAALRERQTPAATPQALAMRLRESLRAEALDALLSGTYAGEPQMRARAAQLGFDLARPHAALWLDVAARHAPGDEQDRATAERTERLAEALASASGAWARARATQVVALLPLAEGHGVTELMARLERLLARELPSCEPGDVPSGQPGGRSGSAWSAGLGEPAVGPAQARRSAGEARDAQRLGLLVRGPCRVARLADLGVYRLLLVLRDRGELAPFVEQSLAPLAADRRTGDALIETLEVFFACNGNLSEAARRLHLHRNSLLYRLGRARELLGQDLNDAELRLSLQLAIKGRRVLNLE